MSPVQLEFAVANDADQGARSYQEDTVRLWRPNGGGSGDGRPLLAVLSDGMGGHVSGEVASRIACERYIDTFKAQDATIGRLLEQALIASNDAISSAVRKDKSLGGMGCTLIAGYFDHDGLRWASVGDSSLLLCRDGYIHRLNADHSFGALLDKQVEAHLISPEQALNDPRRRTLRSALIGEPIVAQDIRSEPERLVHGDWVIIASDGLETLSGDEIAGIIGEHTDDAPAVLARALLDAVLRHRVAHQDNISVVAIKVSDPLQVATRIVRPSKTPTTAPISDTHPVTQAPRCRCSRRYRPGRRRHGAARVGQRNELEWIGLGARRHHRRRHGVGFVVVACSNNNRPYLSRRRLKRLVRILRLPTAFRERTGQEPTGQEKTGQDNETSWVVPTPDDSITGEIQRARWPLITHSAKGPT